MLELSALRLRRPAGAPKAGDKSQRYTLLLHNGRYDGHKNGPLDPNSYIALAGYTGCSFSFNLSIDVC